MSLILMISRIQNPPPPFVTTTRLFFKVSPEGKCRRTTFFYSAVEFGSMDARDGVSGIYPDSGCASLETRSVLLAMFS